MYTLEYMGLALEDGFSAAVTWRDRHAPGLLVRRFEVRMTSSGRWWLMDFAGEDLVDSEKRCRRYLKARGLGYGHRSTYFHAGRAR